MFETKTKTKKVLFKKKRDNFVKKKIRKLFKYLRSELGSSTTHGLPHIVNTNLHWFERIFWIMSFIFSTALIYMLLSAQYKRYMEAPLVMSVEMDYFNWNVSYPAIYLCPFSKADEILHSRFLNDTLQQTGQDLSAYLESILAATIETVHLLQVPEPQILKLINSSDYARIAAEVYRRFDNSSISTVTDSKWSILSEITMTEFGMCDVINSNVAVFDNPIKWNDGDLKYEKNNIELSFHDRDFFVQIMNYADSYKIYTQSPDDVILSGTPSLAFDNDGFLSFGVQMSSTRASKDVRSMSLFLRKCRFTEETPNGRFPVYSYNRCLMQCRIDMIIKLCGCVPHFYRPIENQKVCNLAELKCLEDYVKEITTLSTTKETMEKFEYVDELPKNSRDCKCVDNCEYDFFQKDQEVFLPQEDLNRLRISVATFPKVRISREIIFSIHDIILRSGGVVNLCIGASVISGMEFLMTFIKIPIYEILEFVKFMYWAKERTKVKFYDKED